MYSVRFKNMTSKKRLSSPASLTRYCDFNVTPLNMIQSADLAFSLIVSNSTVSQMIFYTVGASLAESNVTQCNLKGNGANQWHTKPRYFFHHEVQ